MRELDRIQMRQRRKSCAMRLQEEGRHAVSMINRAVSMKRAIEDSKRCNFLVKGETLKTVVQRRGVNKTKTFDSILSHKAVSGTSPYMQNTSYMDRKRPCIE